MIIANNLAFGHSEKHLFEKGTFTINKGKKVGIVGPNGAGKSTLLKLILGEIDITHGSLKVSGRVAYVPQEVKHNKEIEEADTVLSYIDPENNYDKQDVLRMLSNLEAGVDLSSVPKNLSGGLKTKIALARALLSKPDILLLDEPTNFMDVEGKKWVMNFLSAYPHTVVIISHDLALMDRAIDRVLAINPATNTIDEYTGNYSSYVKLKEEKDKLLAKQILIKEKHIKQMEEGLKKMARFTSGKGVRRRIQQKRRIEKEKLALPVLPKEARIKIKLPIPKNVGEIPIRALNITKNYGEATVLDNINFKIFRGERVALIGSNGTGKSTLIKILMELLQPDSGEVIKNPELDVGYYSQEFETFDLNRQVIDVFMEGTKKDEYYSRAFLGRYLLGGGKVFQPIETLSGGEKTRLSIAILTAKNHNLLILDEPTTYLDVMSQRIILEALKEYSGAMLLVSHTPEFVKELNPKRAYLFPGVKEVFWDESLTDIVDEA